MNEHITVHEINKMARCTRYCKTACNYTVLSVVLLLLLFADFFSLWILIDIYVWCVSFRILSVKLFLLVYWSLSHSKSLFGCLQHIHYTYTIHSLFVFYSYLLFIVVFYCHSCWCYYCYVCECYYYRCRKHWSLFIHITFHFNWFDDFTLHKHRHSQTHTDTLQWMMIQNDIESHSILSFNEQE